MFGFLTMLITFLGQGGEGQRCGQLGILSTSSQERVNTKGAVINIGGAGFKFMGGIDKAWGRGVLRGSYPQLYYYYDSFSRLFGL